VVLKRLAKERSPNFETVLYLSDITFQKTVICRGIFLYKLYRP
jgi:hypothetical protein